MMHQNTHIVSCCHWNTTFDSKPLANEFQNKISNWSTYHLHRTIDEVFDTICSDNQIIKIETLTIDLGKIEYEELLRELPLRIKEALRNELYTLLMYPKQGNNTVQIISNSISQIETLRHYLLRGVLSWNYQAEKGTVEEIMQLQLLNNKLELIKMLKTIAIKENVRKRIAWQLKEKTIKTIISGVVPNNYKKINDFSGELIKVQEKENIIQTSTKDLKKNLWYWILNYLFTERGSIFNELSFVKSTIKQMANHFNITYEVLLELIQKAIRKLKEYTHIKKGFIAILQELTKELERIPFQQSSVLLKEKDTWKVLLQYLSLPNQLNTEVKKEQFNRLLIYWCKNDAFKLRKVIVSLIKEKATWLKVLSSLHKETLQVLISVLEKKQSETAIQQLVFLESMLLAKEIKLSKIELWKFGVTFLITNEDISFNSYSFFDFLIEKIAKNTAKSKTEILQKLVYGEVPSTHKNIQFVEVYNELKSLYISSKNTTNKNSSSSEIKELKNISKKHEFTALELFKVLRKYIQVYTPSCTINSRTYSYSVLFLLGLEIDPAQIREIIQQETVATNALQELEKIISFEEFIALITKDTPKEQEEIKSIAILFAITSKIGSTRVQRQLRSLFWKYTITILNTTTNRVERIRRLTQLIFTELFKIETVDATYVLQEIQRSGFIVPELLRKVLQDEFSVFKYLTVNQKEAQHHGIIVVGTEMITIEKLCKAILIDNTIPNWFKNTHYTFQELLDELVLKHPLVILKILRKYSKTELQIKKFSKKIAMDTLLHVLVNIYPTQRKQLTTILQLYQNISFLNLKRSLITIIQEIIHQKVIISWCWSNWKILSSVTIWNEILWEIKVLRNRDSGQILKAFSAISPSLPMPLQISLKQLRDETTIQEELKINANSLPKEFKMKTTELSKEKFGIAIPNAGIVLLNDYFLMLLERLELVKDRDFNSIANKLDAVHYLQYVVTGHSQTEESLLTLNKVLCGIPLTTPIQSGTTIEEKNKILMNGLLMSAISYWPTIGDTSIDGFRGNWLVREGVLYEEEERWDLIIEKRAYDVLLNQSPFSFSIIKLPWMQKPLHVNWPY